MIKINSIHQEKNNIHQEKKRIHQEKNNIHQEKDYITYVISLKKPTKLLNTLKYTHSLDPVLFTGINGKTCPDKIINQHCSYIYSMFGPKSSIGCALSHLNVWKNFLETDKEYAVIFEDDIILDNISTKLSEAIPKYINKTPKNFDILYLGSFGSENTPNFFTMIMTVLNMCSPYRHINKHIYKPQVALAMHAYIISKKGARTLINNLDGNIHNHIDYCIQNLYSKRILNNYITNPRILYQSSTDTSVSSNVSNTHPILINKILSNYYLDTHVKLSYITTLSVFRLQNFNITVSSLILSLIIILLAYFHNIEFSIIFLLLISLPDITNLLNNNCMR